MARTALRDGSPAAARRSADRLPGFPRWDAWPLVALVLLAGLSGYRAQLVDGSYGSFTGCPGCLNASVAANDALIIAVFLSALALARCGIPRAARWALAGAMLLGVAFFAADIVVFRLLTQRLLLSDLLHFSGDLPRLATVAMPWLAQREGTIALAAMLAACVAAWLSIAHAPRSARAAPWIIAAVPIFTAGLEMPRAEYLHSLAYLNMWQVNHQVDASRAYTERFHRLHGQAPTPVLECEAGLGERPSVVLVVVESLSAYHSHLVSGLRDDTPMLDALAREGSHFTAFHANGFSTEGGLIALLTGYVPIPTAGRFGSEMAFTQVKDDFHRWLAARGYATAFFTTGDLGMGRRRQWLQAIGIAYAEGAAHPFYRGMPRGAFDAAADGALVDRFLAWHERERGARPFMATLLTVGTHPPFVAAGHGVVGEDAAVREADRQVARLAARLKERGFFDNGLMIVVGDHRAMTPIPHEERAALGTAAEARIMALALGKTHLAPGEVRGNFQQVDLIPSLRHLMARRTCRDEWQGRFLGAQPDPAIHVVHSDPLRRNELTVIDGSREYRIRLDGDDTRFAGVPQPPRDEAAALLQRVNHERMSRMPQLEPKLRATR
jgi:hypothetical protein